MRKVERRLRDRIKVLEAELAEVTKDRDKFREFFSQNFRKSVELHGQGYTWAMSTLIERLAKQMQQVKWWYW